MYNGTLKSNHSANGGSFVRPTVTNGFILATNAFSVTTDARRITVPQREYFGQHNETNPVWSKKIDTTPKKILHDDSSPM